MHVQEWLARAHSNSGQMRKCENQGARPLNFCKDAAMAVTPLNTTAKFMYPKPLSAMALD
jgi:hypothetical protein